MRSILSKTGLMLCALVMLVLPGTLHAQYDPSVSEDFKDTTTTNWNFVTVNGDGPRLTGNGTIDPVGDGWLRLTAAKNYQESFVYYNNGIQIKFGLVFTFDFVIWKTTTTVPADGFALVIFDADVDPVETGGFGGSLGYAPRSDYEMPGLNGAIVGFGFDTYGNFSTAEEGREGGLAVRQPHSFAIRGSMGDNSTLGYEYLTGTLAGDLDPFSTVGAVNRASATVYSVEVTIATDQKITIRWKPASDSTWEPVIDQYQAALTWPEYVKIGFTASTGTKLNSYQEIRNFLVRPLDEPTLIELSSFDASWQPEGVAVTWVTDTEIANAYFNLYRAESIKTFPKRFKGIGKKTKKYSSEKWMRTGPFEKINAAPIPAEGIAPFGTSYEYLDTDVQSGKRYWYKLQDVDLSGTVTQHGPCGPVSAWEDCSYKP